MVEPTYGASDHYLNTKGESYFKWQGRSGLIDGQIEAHKFRHLIQDTDTVLDFGCGGGFVLHALNCSRRIGVEINPAARQQALTLDVECYADLRDVPDGLADVIISNHALEHVPYPIEALKQLRQKLKLHGTLALCVPIEDWRNHKHYNPNDVDHHLYSWTIQLLGNCLSEAGFAVSEGSISIVTHAWPKYYDFLYQNLPLPLFDFLCNLWSRLYKRRQLIAIVKSN
ncbi:MAG TPA: class I SAM-dependent methyltransferase [Allocoleopsis sp.]